jgi:proteasome lid subunit RPN8/RPN11
MIIPAAVRVEVDEAFARCLPNEACGLLAGRGDCVSRFYPVANALASPVAFAANVPDLFLAFRQMRESGEDLIGIVHSHPNSPAIPSPRDRAEWHYGSVAMVIVDMRTRHWRAWRLTEPVQEISLTDDFKD